jgi:GTPase SAR1 family protein
MSDSDDDEMLQYKIILLGDGTVGKTSIAMRFTNDTFGQSYKQVALLTARWRAQGAHSAAAAVAAAGGCDQPASPPACTHARAVRAPECARSQQLLAVARGQWLCSRVASGGAAQQAPSAPGARRACARSSSLLAVR